MRKQRVVVKLHQFNLQCLVDFYRYEPAGTFLFFVAESAFAHIKCNVLENTRMKSTCLVENRI